MEMRKGEALNYYDFISNFILNLIHTGIKVITLQIVQTCVTHTTKIKKPFNLGTSNVQVCAHDLLGNKMGLRWYVHIVIKEEK